MGSEIAMNMREQVAPDLDPKAVADVRVLIPTGYGLNCEAETAAAFRLLGAHVELLHASELFADPARLRGVSILAFIGGFSFGDHVASGRVFANRLRFRLGDALARYVADGGLAIGMCNGFQVMSKLGLLPGPLAAEDPTQQLAPQRVSVVGNDRLGYRNGWVRMHCDPASPCVWTRGIEWIECPSRHGEGKLVFADQQVFDTLAQERRIPLRYVDEHGEITQAWPANPNGSPDGAAGLCDRSGRVFGLMPHPEAFLYRESHPRWFARDAEVGDPGVTAWGMEETEGLRRPTPRSPRTGTGLRVFANGLRAALSVSV